MSIIHYSAVDEFVRTYVSDGKALKDISLSPISCTLTVMDPLSVLSLGTVGLTSTASDPKQATSDSYIFHGSDHSSSIPIKSSSVI